MPLERFRRSVSKLRGGAELKKKLRAWSAFMVKNS